MFTLQPCAAGCGRPAITGSPVCAVHSPNPRGEAERIGLYIGGQKTVKNLNAQGLHFEGINFSGHQFYGCDFIGASFTSCRFDGVFMRTLFFDFSTFTDCEFSRGDFQYLSNVALVGYSMVQAILGDGYLFHLTAYNIPFNFIAFSFGAWLIAKEGHNALILSWKTVINPAMAGVIIGFVFFLFSIPLPPILYRSGKIRGLARYRGDHDSPVGNMGDQYRKVSTGRHYHPNGLPGFVNINQFMRKRKAEGANRPGGFVGKISLGKFMRRFC
jgi:hypothetical protein